MKNLGMQLQLMKVVYRNNSVRLVEEANKPVKGRNTLASMSESLINGLV